VRLIQDTAVSSYLDLGYFQFYYSAINTKMSQGFNYYPFQIFNSTIVRLIRWITKKNDGGCTFQFYYSAINTPIAARSTILESVFQFYYSAINTTRI